MSLLAVTGNALWVIGLAIILSDLGWRLWLRRSGMGHSPLSSSGVVVDCGGLIACLGLALVVDQPWGRILFALLAVTLGVLAVSDLRAPAEERS